MTELSRRGFLHGVLAGGGALALAACGGGGQATRIRHADQTGELTANLYITVRPDGRIALIVNNAEIGQGVSTGYATMVAEELGAPLDHIDVTYAGADKRMRRIGLQITGGSTSTAEAFGGLRKAAASAREMLIAAAAASWRVAPEQCHAADGHVRCGERALAFAALTRDAARQDVPSEPRLKPAKDFTLIGKVDRRIDARGKVDGTAVFGIDVRFPDMVNAYAIHGPSFGARPTAVRVVREHPGVLGVYRFDWGVAIVADKFWQARAAAADVEITWDAGALRGLDSETLTAAMRVHDGEGKAEQSHGDAGAALAHAETRVGGIYEAPYLAHAPLEPQNATAHVVDGKVELWAPTQSPTLAQAFIASALGLDMDDVTVHVTLCGGGFGRRAIADVCAQAAQVAARVGRPVKLTWTRESDMTQAWYRPVYAVRVEGAVAGGAVTGARIHCISQSIALSGKTLFGAALSGLPGPVRRRVTDAALAIFSTNSVGDVFATEGLRNTPYQLPSFELRSEPVQNALPVAFWRSVGNSVTGFVMEGLIDELAVAARQDPFALRRALVPAGSRQRRVLDRLEQLSGWRTPAAPGIGRGLARHLAFDTEVGQVA
ncbi:MAG TPA: molybdopterin cofactor-binding domain-containing protein, partial [Kofleriaceae bacterium]